MKPDVNDAFLFANIPTPFDVAMQFMKEPLSFRRIYTITYNTK